MKISKKNLRYLIENFLKEAPDGIYPNPEDLARSKYKADVRGKKEKGNIDKLVDSVKKWYNDEGQYTVKTFEEVWDNLEGMVSYFADYENLSDLKIEFENSQYDGYTPVSFFIKAYIWPAMKRGDMKVHLPVYAFIRYLCGDTSDLTAEEIIANIDSGQEYLDALTSVLDIAAKPNDGTYEDGHLKNGFALKWDGKPYSFYVVNYKVHWGENGKMATEWVNALAKKGDLGRHWGPTLGNSGLGGKQFVEALKSGGTGEALLRPDFNNGFHLIKNEFDFKRMASGQSGIDEIEVSKYIEDLLRQLSEVNSFSGKIERIISWVAGRSLKMAELVAGFPSPGEFNFDFKVKSNITKWPSFSEYPLPGSVKNILDSEPKLEQITGVLDEISHLQEFKLKI